MSPKAKVGAMRVELRRVDVGRGLRALRDVRSLRSLRTLRTRRGR